MEILFKIEGEQETIELENDRQPVPFKGDLIQLGGIEYLVTHASWTRENGYWQMIVSMEKLSK